MSPSRTASAFASFASSIESPLQLFRIGFLKSQCAGLSNGTGIAQDKKLTCAWLGLTYSHIRVDKVVVKTVPRLAFPLFGFASCIEFESTGQATATARPN